MDTLEDALRRIISEQYGSVSKFAEAADVPASSVYSALSRGMKNTRTELTDRIYRTLNIDWDTASLDDYSGLKIKGHASEECEVPLLGRIAAGSPIEMDAVDDTHPIPADMRRRYPTAFLLRVEGSSMDRVLPNGSFALVEPCDAVTRDNAPYAVAVNGFDATIKRVRRLANGLELAPDSNDPTYRPQVYDFADADAPKVTVIGRVVWYTLPFDWEL